MLLGSSISSSSDVLSGWTQSTIKNGTRSSSATSYLAPEFIRRPNLNVLLHAHVTRIFPTVFSEQLTFGGVEFSQDQGSKNRIVQME